MSYHELNKIESGIFITFSGNCKQALLFYQTCFGGIIQLDTFNQDLKGYMDVPVISGSLVSDKIVIHGSDLVHNEGRKIGNYVSIFYRCDNEDNRRMLIEKFERGRRGQYSLDHRDREIIEVVDAFDVRWVLCI